MTTQMTPNQLRAEIYAEAMNYAVRTVREYVLQTRHDEKSNRALLALLDAELANPARFKAEQWRHLEQAN